MLFSETDDAGPPRPRYVSGSCRQKQACRAKDDQGANRHRDDRVAAAISGSSRG